MYLYICDRCAEGRSLAPQPTQNVSFPGSWDANLELGREIGKNMSRILDDVLKTYDARVRPMPDDGKTI